MKKSVMIALIVAASLMLLGCIVLGGAMAMMNFDLSSLTVKKYLTNTYEITDEVFSIAVDTNTADITFIPKDGSGISVVCVEEKNLTHTVTTADKQLTIKLNDTRKWYEHISLYSKKTSLTVYLPRGEYGDLRVSSDTGDLSVPKDFKFGSIEVTQSTGDINIGASVSENIKIKASTGDILLEGISARSLELSTSTGDITLRDSVCEGDVSISVSTGKTRLFNVKCGELRSVGDTGDINLGCVIVSGRLSVERSTGDVSLEGSDAAELFILTDTGDVSGNLLSDKIFITRTDTGRISVPSSATGGKCEITTDTGDIRIEIQK
ncbi:MAG: DUF4097 domain-containing protein [Ruminococcaceae bacterium]|nr:DUF4097 domain-containing protein [Oscillospiraceae bacterium]